ncbi:MAG: CHC2 zinc finger domain-containing protein [Chloroflexi bacterium]|nr:CHC2 zinc finger domain-containing protein [Chloroflexota bacterium]
MTIAVPRIDIAAVKARHDLAAIVESAGVKLRGTGRVRQGVCPFHDEAEGSFTVYGDSQRWYCFGCGEGGDVLDFIQRTESVPLAGALQLLGGTAAPTPPDTPRESRAYVEPPPARDRAILTAAARFYAAQLLRSEDALAYLEGRGITIATAIELGLGYAPGVRLREALLAAGFDGERVARCGLFTERGAERFAGTLVVPDAANGQVRWLGGRAITRDARARFQALTGPKPVLGLGRIPPDARWVIVTEGMFDWLTLSQWGLPACAALGTQGLERVAQAVSRFANVFVAFDRDDAGIAAAERLSALLGRRSAVVRLPRDFMDVGELATAPDGRAAFIAQLAEAARERRTER